MKRRLLVAVAALAAASIIVSSAFAFDCIRVSSSWQGLQQSTKSGNWLAFNMSSPAAVTTTFENATGGELPADVAKCISDQYATYGLSPYFALGIGVAGGHSGQGIGVLAWHNKNDQVFGNLKGIDHLDDSPFGQALFGSLGACGIDIEG